MSVDVQAAKQDINLVEYAEQVTGTAARRIGPDSWRFNPCPACGGNDHFTITNRGGEWYYKSFSDCCKGGDIFNFVVEIEKAASGFIGAVEHLEQQGLIRRTSTPASRSATPKKPGEWWDTYRKKEWWEYEL